MFSLITSYEDAWKAIIMPPRQEYTIYDLGLDKFNAKQNKIQRLDFQLINKKGYILECSFYQQMNITTPHPCVVYSHGSGCSRLEALQYLDLILSHPISFFTFDFTGSGKSGGVYSTVGWFEQEDLECVIDYIRCTGKISKIALWGRSMGATTSIFYGAKHGGIECMILDSPFANFKKFIKEFIKKKLPLPGFLASGAFDMIRSTILKKANFDLGELKPIKHINKVKIPLLFGVGEGDTFVPIDHTIDLHAASRGEKKILHVFEGDHNSTRPPVWMKYVSDFLVANLLPPTKKEPGQYANSPTLHTSPSIESDFSKGVTQFSPAKQYHIKNFVEPPSRQFTYFTTLQDDELLAKDQKVYRTIANNEDIVKKTAFKKGKSNEVGSFQRNEISPESPSRYKGPSILKSYQDPEYPNILAKNSFTSHTNSSFKHSESTELYGGPKRVEQKTGPKLVISDPREMVSKGDKTQKPESQGHLIKTKGEYVHSGRGHHRAASSINGSLPTSTNTTSNSYTPHYMQKIDQHPTSTFSLASLNLHTSESPTVTSSNSVYNSNPNLALGAQGKKSSLSSWLAVNPKNLYAREKSEIPLSDPNNKSPSKRHNQTTMPNYESNRGLSIKVEVHNPSIHYNQVKTPNDYSKPINFSYGTTYQTTESFSHISSMNSTSATNSYSAANIKGRLIDMKGNNESGQASSYDDKFRVHPIAREYMTNERKMSVDNLNGHKSRFHTNRS